MMNLPPKVKPGQPVRASHHNQILDALGRLGTVRNKYAPLQRSRVVPENSHPFKITLGEDSNGAKIVRVAAGYWIGDGVTAYGWTGDKMSPGDVSTELPPRMQDSFKVSAGEFKFTASETGKYWLFVQNEAKVGRVFGAWGTESVLVKSGSTETEIVMLNRMYVDYIEDEHFSAEIIQKRPYCALIGSVNFATGEIVQLVRDNIFYSPKPGVAAPLVFHPVQNAENTFECLGGLLRVLPNTVKGGKRAVGHLYDQDNTSISGDFDAEGCVPRRETLQAYTTAIPPWSFKIEKLIDSESENGGAPVNGWLVFLRVRMAYRKCYPMDTECVVPVPVIEWDYAPIPNGGAKVGSPWEFTNTEIQGFSSTELGGAHRTFTHVKNGERMPIPNTFVGTWTSSFYDWSFAYTFAVNTEAFESIIPIGIFHCPFVPVSNWSSSSFRTPERIVYCPLKTGIIDWTPPAEFDFNGTAFIWND